MIQPKNFIFFNQMSLSVRKQDQCTTISFKFLSLIILEKFIYLLRYYDKSNYIAAHFVDVSARAMSFNIVIKTLIKILNAFFSIFGTQHNLNRLIHLLINKHFIIIYKITRLAMAYVT